ncbi:hypothetical protein TBLA_0B06290 [Henningerozyma blattae CBS 6284]|uniref:Tricalbin n=1 Tax=Henningerozyma blattae (strain ATCC 34711 / CBS 6284 / DSM 70876 / NBRC 10599 / NRRL Y-10934 / UCD 77-7) TaxID=1071380 RepID=I2GZA1_HENB6|nr:hypothetical protein TBLA_0B06290 [Tetrapisispora blattae CBS 6284]CCH59453.1 hypothetical protein TBLA_0B06290 [Tetrapisispora blattae CBS 6284]
MIFNHKEKLQEKETHEGLPKKLLVGTHSSSKDTNTKGHDTVTKNEEENHHNLPGSHLFHVPHDETSSSADDSHHHLHLGLKKAINIHGPSLNNSIIHGSSQNDTTTTTEGSDNVTDINNSKGKNDFLEIPKHRKHGGRRLISKRKSNSMDSPRATEVMDFTSDNITEKEKKKTKRRKSFSIRRSLEKVSRSNTNTISKSEDGTNKKKRKFNLGLRKSLDKSRRNSYGNSPATDTYSLDEESNIMVPATPKIVTQTIPDNPDSPSTPLNNINSNGTESIETSPFFERKLVRASVHVRSISDSQYDEDKHLMAKVNKKLKAPSPRKLEELEAARHKSHVESSEIKQSIPKFKKEYLKKINTIDKNKLYPWRHVAEFHADGKGHVNKKRARDIEAYIKGTFYNDVYINVSAVFVTCLFAWLFAYWNCSWLSLGIVFCFTAQIYNNEYRRFNRNIRDDLKRVTVKETLSSKLESTSWLNSFLKKFWIIFMPVMSTEVKNQLNIILATIDPGFGVDSMELTEFTLGSKAPSIDGIKTYTKYGGRKKFCMDLSIAFTPGDINDMTAKEISQRIEPRVVLSLKIKKGIVSKDLKVICENLNVSGIVRLLFEFSSVYPNIKVVSLQLLKPPQIDFVLKPLGGDTLGLDVMSAFPGFKDAVQSSINGTLGPMMYAPNKLDINIDELMCATQGNDAIGLLVITINSANSLKSSDFITNTVDPYIIFKLDKRVNEQIEIDPKTSIKSDTKTPVWNETYYLLINDLKQNLTMLMYDFNDVRTDTFIGEIEFNLMDLLEDPSLKSTTSTLVKNNKPRGNLNYSYTWYPIINTGDDKLFSTNKDAAHEHNADLDSLANERTATTTTTLGSAAFEEVGLDGNVNNANSEENNNNSFDKDADYAHSHQPESDTGICKLSLNSIRNLNTSVTATGRLNPSAVLSLDGKVLRKFRTLKRINEPSWGETYEFFVPSKQEAQLKLEVFHESSSSRSLICEYTAFLDDLISGSGKNADFYQGSPQGDIYMPIQWKPLQVEENSISNNAARTDIGAIRLFVKEVNVISHLDGIGDIDPYFKVYVNKKIMYVSKYHSDCSNPLFNTKVYLPIKSENQVITIELFDYQSVGKDRLVGTTQIAVSNLIKRDKNAGNYICDKIPGPLKKYFLENKDHITTNDYVNCSLIFIPVSKVFSPEEYESIVELEKDLKERRAKFEEKQLLLKNEMEKNPSDWEIVNIKDPFEEDEKALHKKVKMTLKELINCNSGILSFRVYDGKLSQPTAFLQILVDDVVYPAFTSLKAQNGKLIGEIGSVFIRDLSNSIITFRITKKFIVSEPADIINEMTLSTTDFLKAGYMKPITLDYEGNVFDMKFLYNPTIHPLPITESVEDTGYLDLDIISASNLIAADRSGTSDPYVLIFIDGLKMYKSKIVEKTLDPIWNESVKLYIPSRAHSTILIKLYDWDMVSSDDFLGETLLDVSKMEIEETTSWNLNLDTQGSIQLKATFAPQFAKPLLGMNGDIANNTPMRKENHRKRDVIKTPLGVVQGGIGGIFTVVAKTGEFIIDTMDGNIIKIIVHDDDREFSNGSRLTRSRKSSIFSRKMIHGDEDNESLNDGFGQPRYSGHFRRRIRSIGSKIGGNDHLQKFKDHGKGAVSEVNNDFKNFTGKLDDNTNFQRITGPGKQLGKHLGKDFQTMKDDAKNLKSKSLTDVRKHYGSMKFPHLHPEKYIR